MERVFLESNVQASKELKQSWKLYILDGCVIKIVPLTSVEVTRCVEFYS